MEEFLQDFKESPEASFLKFKNGDYSNIVYQISKLYLI